MINWIEESYLNYNLRPSKKIYYLWNMEINIIFLLYVIEHLFVFIYISYKVA